MARIIFNGETITPELAMRWFCWNELIPVMEKDRLALDTAIKQTPHNVPDWEMQVLKKFLELIEHDLVVD